MKISLLGYGKMGKAIEKIALSRNHKIISIIDENFLKGEISEADVAINFSTPSSAKDNILLALKKDIPVISGTTGWLDNLNFIENYCIENNKAFLYSSNFSIGVNIFFKINEILSKLINPYPEYTASLEEIHHIEKLDSPSGTAIKLAQDIIENSDFSEWTVSKKPTKNQLKINVDRTGENPGYHSVNYDSKIDLIKIEHKAKSRDGFALGAVIAAEWIINKKGVFKMSDVLKMK
jgi:4-hydroxy-tetrahydrodipicolinate reductase